MAAGFQNTFFIDYNRAMSRFYFQDEDEYTPQDRLAVIQDQIRAPDFRRPSKDEIHVALARLSGFLAEYEHAGSTRIPNPIWMFYAVVIWMQRTVLARHLWEQDAENRNPREVQVLDEEEALDQFTQEMLDAQQWRLANESDASDESVNSARWALYPDLDDLLSNAMSDFDYEDEYDPFSDDADDAENVPLSSEEESSE